MFFKNTNNDSKFLDLNQIKMKLILGNYQSPDDWIFDLNNFFNKIIEKKRTSSLEKHGAKILLDIIKSKSKRIFTLNLDDWISVFIVTYTELTSLIMNSPEKLKIANIAIPMQVDATSVDFTEEKLSKMKQQLENNIDDKGRKIVSRLIMILEPDMHLENNSLSFNLKNLRNETLLAIKTFLKHNKKVTPKNVKPVELFD